MLLHGFCWSFVTAGGKDHPRRLLMYRDAGYRLEPLYNNWARSSRDYQARQRRRNILSDDTAAHHMNCFPVGMYDFRPMPDIEVDTPSGCVPMEGIGKLDVRFADDPEGGVITLNDVVHVPRFHRQLFSLGACTDQGLKCREDADDVKVQKTGVYFTKSGPKRLSKALVFHMASSRCTKPTRRQSRLVIRLKMFLISIGSIVATVICVNICWMTPPINLGWI